MTWRLALMLMAAARTWACVCTGNELSVKEAWEKTPAVFLGTVEMADPDSQTMFQAQAVRIRVDEAFKGVSAGQTIQLHQGTSDCDAKFRTGHRAVFYLYPGRTPGSWSLSGCTHSFGRADPPGDDLLFLRGLPGSLRKNRLAGEITLYENSVSEGFRQSRVLSGIHVYFRSANHSAEAVTNENGVYEFYDLPPDHYRIVIDVPKGLRIKFPIIAGGEGRRDRFEDLRVTEPVVELGGDTAADVSFLLIVDNQISGRVLDSSGKPVKDVCVHLNPAVGETDRGFLISKCAEDDGSYQLKDMPSGRYLITAQRWANGRLQTSKIFYPGTTERENAVVVTIGSGAHLDGFDIRMTQ